MIEMVIPSSLDPTVAPPGKHVVLLFTQYTPYTLAGGCTWDNNTRNQYADTGWDDSSNNSVWVFFWHERIMGEGSMNVSLPALFFLLSFYDISNVYLWYAQLRLEHFKLIFINLKKMS